MRYVRTRRVAGLGLLLAVLLGVYLGQATVEGQAGPFSAQIVRALRAYGLLTPGQFTGTVRAPVTPVDCSAPQYSFQGDTDTGISYIGANEFAPCVGGAALLDFFASNIRLTSTTILGWASGSALSTATDTALSREGAGHPFQKNSTNAQRLSIANTYTSSTSYEAFSVDWQTQANVALVGTRTAATGTGRPLRIGSQAASGANSYAMISMDASASPVMTFALANSGLTPASTATAGTFFQHAVFTSTATSGSVIPFAITPTYNQSSGTAANTDLLVNRTQTAVGSGVQRLFDLQIGGTTKHYVTADGTAKGTQEVFTQATAPTCTSANNCGTGNGTFATGSSDTAGSVTLGTTPASGFIITFNGTWPTAPVCNVWMNKAGMVVGKMPLTTVTSTTTITVVTNGTAPATGDIYAYRCTGLQ